MDLEKLLEEPDLAAMAGRIRKDPDAPFPFLVAKVKLTWRCNLRCRVCALWRLPEDRSSPPLCTEKVGELLSRLNELGLRKVHFSGGEVLLRDDFPIILEKARELELQVNLTTNGTLLDKETARQLIAHRVHTAAFSIDGATEKKHDAMRGVEGAWRKTWKGIERLRARKEAKGRGPVLAVNTVVTRKNIERLPEMYELLKSRGIDSWRLLPVRTQDSKLRPNADQWADLASAWEDWKPMLTRQLAGWRSIRNARRAAKGKYAGITFEDHPCFAPWFNIFIDADGAVYPCCTGRYKMPAYGNVLESPLDEIISSINRREICASMASGHEFEVCRSCDEFLEENEIFARAANGRVVFKQS